MPEEGVPKISHDRIFRNEEMLELVRAAAGLGIDKVRLTGGEPLVRKGILSLVEQIKAVPGIKTVVMTSNGFLLGENARRLREAGLDRINLSLDTLRQDRFREISRRDVFPKVMEGLDAALEAGLTPLKINTVLMKGFNDDEIGAFGALARDRDLEVRFIELMPVGETASWYSRHYLPNRAVLDALPGLIPLDRGITGDPGSPADLYEIPGGRGRIGLINPISHKFCSQCNRIRISSEGFLLPCLHSDRKIDIRERWNAGISTEDILREAILFKPKEHRLDLGETREAVKAMHRVGG
jgi:cyclic pyranopterin phosphate synthase